MSNQKMRQTRSAYHLNIEGSGKVAVHQAQSRLMMTLALAALVYVVIAGRLLFLGTLDPDDRVYLAKPDIAITASRPDIRDRNGEVLATDIVTSSLYGEPRRIVDVDEAVEKLSRVIPDLDIKTTHKRLSSKAGFVWLRRELAPAVENQILELGIPGIGFRKETRRFYPKGKTASHLVGHVNIDNVGIAGLEKYIDDRGLKQLRELGLASNHDMEPVYLSIDLRAQHFVRDELAKAMDRYSAVAAGAIILNAHTGEVIAMASLPDYDPNRPVDALKKDRLNRVSGGAYEMGSTFKAFTTAMALDSGKVRLNDTFDARKPLRIGGHEINDFHAQRRIMSVPDVFIYSSNIGTVKMAETVGVDHHKAFLSRMGLLDKTPFELPEVASPLQPKTWRAINSATISYGHGVTTTPLQTAVAGAALVNGGKLLAPTLFPKSRGLADREAVKVLSEATSRDMRKLMRLNVVKGSGKRAEVTGFVVGGKTGTAEKVVNKRYSSDHRFNAFLAAFPIDDPQYVVLTFIDEPKPEEGKKSATAGLNAAPMVANIIRRSAPILGVVPNFGNHSSALLISN